MNDSRFSFCRRCRDVFLLGGARVARPALLVLGLVVAVGLAESEPQQAVLARLQAERAKRFETDVLPLLQNRCVKCHGEKAREGGLRFGGAEDL